MGNIYYFTKLLKKKQTSPYKEFNMKNSQVLYFFVNILFLLKYASQYDEEVCKTGFFPQQLIKRFISIIFGFIKSSVFIFFFYFPFHHFQFFYDQII